MGEQAKISSEWLGTVHRFLPTNTADKKVAFSGETPKYVCSRYMVVVVTCERDELFQMQRDNKNFLDANFL
jgi:hypothetical protein